MLIENLLVDLKYPCVGIGIAAEQLSDRLSDSWEVFSSSGTVEDFNNLQGLCYMLVAASEYLKTLTENYQQEVRKKFSEITTKEL